MKEEKSVRLSHLVVSRAYYGSNTGWSTTVHSKEVGEPHAAAEGETLRLTCSVDDCRATLTFRLATREERKQFFWRAFKRRLMMFGSAISIAALGALLEWASNDIVALKVIGFLLIIPGDIAGVVLLALLLFGGRANKYDLSYVDYGALKAGIQHGVELT